MDWTLSEDQLAWRARARAFADEVVRPRSRQLDAQPDPGDGFSWDIVEAASDRGLRCAPLSPAVGGGGVGFLTATIILEEIARADMGAATLLAQSWKFAQAVGEVGDDGHRQRWLAPLVADPRGLVAAAMTEPDTGSDTLLPYMGADAGPRTSAERRGDDWVLRGRKCYITNGNRARMILVFARTDPGKGLVGGVTAFLVARRARPDHRRGARQAGRAAGQQQRAGARGRGGARPRPVDRRGHGVFAADAGAPGAGPPTTRAARWESRARHSSGR